MSGQTKKVVLGDNLKAITLKEVIDHRVYSIDEVMVNVIVAEIDPQKASEILQEFASELPLQQYNLGHMKRVRRSEFDRNVLEILICPERYLKDVPEVLKDRCKANTSKVISIPKLKPLTRTEYEEWGRSWPTMFRPNAVDKEREVGFFKEDVSQHANYMSLVEKDAEDVASEWKARVDNVSNFDNDSSFDSFSHALRGGGLMVNPQNGMVIMTSHAVMVQTIKKKGLESLTNPLLNTAMLCIEGTAAIVRGEIDAKDKAGGSCIPADSYLCTGLDLYLTVEPDLMTSMALVHSRIRRVFYHTPCLLEGALGTHYNIHSLRSLNHHFRVFKMSYENQLSAPSISNRPAVKRKVIPFPSSTPSLSIKRKAEYAVKLPKESRMNINVPLKAIEEEDLKLPSDHFSSLQLLSEEEICEIQLNPPDGLLACYLLQPGLLELTIQSGAATGYGVRSWPFRIGGVGLIHDGFDAHVAVRCSIPISHSHIDDAGFVSELFWKDGSYDISINPRLRPIVERLIALLKANPNTINGKDREWKESEEHCYKKVSVINTYKSMALFPALVDAKGAINLEWLAPSLRCKNTGLMNSELLTAISPGVFSFDLFTPQFCDMLVAEVDNYEATTLPRRRPNTMNRFGLILNEIGLEQMMSDLLTRFIGPLCKTLYPTERVAVGLDHHHTFCVVYSETGDKGLDLHHDASEVTLNVCLGRTFEGSGLVFCGQAGQVDHRKHRHVYSHHKGKAVIHLGRQRHGADKISSGERINLIMWARSSTFRCAAVNGLVNPDGFPRLAEDGPPDRICLSASNDADYVQQMSRISNEESEAK